MSNAVALIQEWIKESAKKVTIIPRSGQENTCDEVLGITEHSVLGTIFNHTGGLILADGLIRHFGGNNHFGLSLAEANRLSGKKPTLFEGVLIVAIDLYGGLFGININYSGVKPGDMIYLPPESYTWFPMEIGHSAFVQWSMTEKVSEFYMDFQHLPVLSDIPFDMVVQYMPPLWSVDPFSSSHFEISAIAVSQMLAIRAGYLDALNQHFDQSEV